MKSLAEAAIVVVPNGRWAGWRIGDLCGEEEGRRWLRYAMRKHPDADVREAAATVLFVFDDNDPPDVPTLAILLPVEGRVRLATIAASDADLERLILSVTTNEDRTALLAAAMALREAGR